MKPASLLKISVTTTAQAEDAVSAALEKILGHTPSIYANEKTKVSTVTIYGAADLKWTPAVKRLVAAELEKIRSEGLDIGRGKISAEKLPRENWAESWKKHFPPFEIGGALLIKPSWSRRKPRRNQHVVILDPGLSFGTGHHATTGFCLRELAAQNDCSRKTFLDIGTGSGILAIAAVKLGFSRVEAFDFDPESVRVARENSSVNSVSARLRLRRADLTKLPVHCSRPFDFVCANLISNLLIAERRRIVSRVNPGGRLVLAGVLAAEFAEVRRAFEETGMRFVRAAREREWRSGAFVRLC